MADIFISYTSGDRDRVEPLAKALKKHGWSVWWDRDIPPGKTYVQVIKAAITSAKCVVVIWSEKSIESDWVIEEANIGKQRGILVPAQIKAVESPIGFGLIHTADLSDWEGQTDHREFNSLINAILEIMEPASPGKETSQSIDTIPVVDAEQIAETDSTIENLGIEPDLKGDAWDVYSKIKSGISKAKRKNWIIPGLILVGIVLGAAGWLIMTTQDSGASFTNSIGMKFVLIQSGKFTTGKIGKLQEVTMSQPFYLQTTEVTQGQWKAVMGDNPSHYKKCGADCPVETVSWDDAQRFLKKLNEIEKTDTYCLPKEAEWEYACRAETDGVSFEDNRAEIDKYAWNSSNSNDRTHPVGGTAGGIEYSNPWGLYDMLGNVWELTDSVYGEDEMQKVLRGTSFNDIHDDVRCTYRTRLFQAAVRWSIGFRCAKNID